MHLSQVPSLTHTCYPTSRFPSSLTHIFDSPCIVFYDTKTCESSQNRNVYPGITRKDQRSVTNFKPDVLEVNVDSCLWEVYSERLELSEVQPSSPLSFIENLIIIESFKKHCTENTGWSPSLPCPCVFLLKYLHPQSPFSWKFNAN